MAAHESLFRHVPDPVRATADRALREMRVFSETAPTGAQLECGREYVRSVIELHREVLALSRLMARDLAILAAAGHGMAESLDIFAQKAYVDV